MVQVLYHLEVFKQLNLFNKYLLLVTFETNDNYSIRFEMKKHYSHSTTICILTDDGSVAAAETKRMPHMGRCMHSNNPPNDVSAKFGIGATSKLMYQCAASKPAV